MGREIHVVSPEIFIGALFKWIDGDKHIEPTLLLCQEGDVWVAADNTSGDFWVEDFKTESAARRWLLDSDLSKEDVEKMPEKEKINRVISLFMEMLAHMAAGRDPKEIYDFLYNRLEDLLRS